MGAYEPERWHELFVMTGGAAAALAGLLFVAISLNLEHVLRYGYLPALSAQTLSLLVGLVIASALVLAPQGATALGVELLVLAVAITAMLFVPTVRGLPQAEKLHWKLLRLASAVVGSAPLIGAGVSMTAGAGGGLFWLLGWIVAALVIATYNAWVLLIEIRR